MADDERPILVTGFGSVGRRHFRNLRALGRSRFVFVRSGHGVLDDSEIAEYPSVPSLEQGLAYNPSIVIVAGPTSTHLDVAIAAARKGCDLYIEKPLGDSLTGADELVDLVSSKSLVAMIGCQFRFHPLILEIERTLRDGHLGSIVGASAEWGEYLPLWHPWEDHRQSYSARSDLGGGAFLTLIHPIDYLLMLFGDCRVRSAFSASVPALATSAGEDWGDIALEFENGVHGQVHLDYIQNPLVHRLSIVGDAGRLACDLLAGRLEIWSGGQYRLVGLPDGFERNCLFMDAMSHFLDCVDRRSATRCDVSDGVRALAVVISARARAARGESIER